MTVDWWLCAAGKTLRAQLNARFAARDKASDGSVGDTSHAARRSDHNPDPSSSPPGVVRAIDLDEDFDGIPNGDSPLANLLVAQILTAPVDERLEYVIHEGVWWRRRNGFRAERYTGVNAHGHHVHVSFNAKGDHDGRPFDLPVLALLEPQSDAVREAQEALAVLARACGMPGLNPGPIDGQHGRNTTRAVRAYQGAMLLEPTGALDPVTLAALGVA